MKEDIKLVCFDLNKTLIDENARLDLNLAMGMTKEEDDFLFNLWDEGSITYAEWQKILENIYKIRGKATYDNIYKVITNYTFKPGAQELITYLHAQGYKVALISGSIDMLVGKIAKELNIVFYGANNILKFDSNNYLSEIKVLGEDRSIKLQQLQQFCLKLGINTKQCVCVGDGDNDSLMFEECQHGITFNDSKIKHLAWKTISKLSDLKDVL